MIKPELQMEAAKAMQPDAVAALSSETPAAASRKAAVEATKRSLRWLDECLQVSIGQTHQRSSCLAICAEHVCT